MPSEQNTVSKTLDHKRHATFFRESGWLMIASIAAGFMSLGVHFLNKNVADADYSHFVVLLMVVTCLPTLPLQMVFAKQTAATLAANRERQLAAMIRQGWLWTFLVWLVLAVVILVFSGKLVQAWQLPSAVPLFVTVVTILAAIWMPLFLGVLQGRQDFFWMGWATILGGVLRFGAAAVFVICFHWGATGMLAGALAGVGATAVIGGGRTRDLWTMPSEPFNGRELLSQIMPLILGFGVCQFLFTTDSMFASAHFSPTTMKSYMAAGTLSRALLWLVLPLAAVMFPKIVHSTTKNEKSNLLAIVIAGTAFLAICGTIGLSVLGPIVVRIVFSAGAVAATTALLPWYAAAMIPLALANVMVNDLMARGRYKVVPYMIVIAISYGFTLPYMLKHYDSMIIALQTLGVFNLLLFVVCAYFTWGIKESAPVQKPLEAAAGQP